MSASRARFLRISALLMVIALSALLLIVGATFWLAQRSQAISDDLTSWRVARATAINLRNALQVAESSQRGYLITADTRYLVPYEEQVTDILPLYGRMAAAVEPLFDNMEDLGRFEQAINAKLAEMAETIQLLQNNRRDEAYAIVHTDVGKNLMNEVTLFFAQTIDAADENSRIGVEKQRENYHALRLVAGLGGVVIILVVAGSILMVLRYTREIIEARSELESLNSGLEARINERTQDLIRANEEVQRFAYIVTHDLRAPLVNIMGFTSELDATMKTIQAHVLAEPGKSSEMEIADAKLAVTEDLPEAIGFIRSSTKKMDGLINAILKISREGRRALKPEPIDVKTMLEASLASIHHQIAQEDGEAKLEVAVSRIICDRMSLEQIVGNLLDNAVKYKSPDRPLRLKVTVSRRPGDRLCFEFEDNGRGIAQQDHERVFDLFRRAGNQDKAGEGIGLAHVRTLTRSLGGDITVKSEFGRGSTFSVELPIDLRTVIKREV